jgi:hypothetical protein
MQDDEPRKHTIRIVIPWAVPGDRFRGVCLRSGLNAQDWVFLDTATIASGPVVPRTVARRLRGIGEDYP